MSKHQSKKSVKSSKASLLPISLIKPGELVIAYTFKRRAREKFGLNEQESEEYFKKSLDSNLIERGRDVYPGVPAYQAYTPKK